MKHIYSTGFIAATALAACFGAGAAPSAPSQATVVYVAPTASPDHRCNGTAVYIGNVALAAGSGYAATLPYQPPACNGGGNPGGAVTINAFAENGVNPSGMMVTGMFGMASTNGGTGPQIASNGSTVLWAYDTNNGMNGGTTLTLGPSNVALTPNGMTNGGNVATGVVVAATQVYIAVQAMSGGGFFPDPNNPQFPCCGSTNPPMSTDLLVRTPIPTTTGGSVTPTSIAVTDPATLQFYSDELSNVLVANSSHAFFMARGDIGSGHLATIGAVDTTDFSVATVDTISSTMQNVVPVGFAADDAHVVWVAAYPAPSNGTLQPGCWIWSHDLRTGTTHMLLQTSAFSCMGAAVDATRVYFTIVRSETTDCGGCTAPLHGDGIARVALADGAFESIAFGIAGYGSGPRRVFLVGDQIYAIDPLVIAKIATSAFQGQTDIPK